jgi:2',3'-cyclic-nucleotide 2'-phosphodiesterase/3'-nucleotidase
VLIGAAHLGETAEFDQDNRSDSGVKIAEMCPELDLLMLGHFHSDVNTEVNGVKILECKKNGTTVGRFDININSHNEVTSVTTQLINMQDYEPSTEITNLPVVVEAHQATIYFIKVGVKDADGNLQSVSLGQYSDNFQPANEKNTREKI